VSGGIPPLLALILAVLAAATPVAAAPSGPPVRIGSTLALTGPLAATSTIHKIAGEISVEQITSATASSAGRSNGCCPTISRNPR